MKSNVVMGILCMGLLICVVLWIVDPLLGIVSFCIVSVILIPLFVLGKAAQMKEYRETERQLQEVSKVQREEGPKLTAAIYESVHDLIMKTQDSDGLKNIIQHYILLYPEKESDLNYLNRKRGFFQILAIKKIYLFPEVKAYILGFWQDKKLTQSFLQSCSNLGRDRGIELLKDQLNIILSLYAEDMRFLESFFGSLLDVCSESSLRYFVNSCELTRINIDVWNSLKDSLVWNRLKDVASSEKIAILFQKEPHSENI